MLPALKATTSSGASATMPTANLLMGWGSHWLCRQLLSVRCWERLRYGELRATDTVFKTELCRWWANGSCKAWTTCSDIMVEAKVAEAKI